MTAPVAYIVPAFRRIPKHPEYPSSYFRSVSSTIFLRQRPLCHFDYYKIEELDHSAACAIHTRSFLTPIILHSHFSCIPAALSSKFITFVKILGQSHQGF